MVRLQPEKEASGGTVQQILQVWSALDMRRRVVVAGASVAMFATIIVMSRMAAAPSMALLYSGLDPAAAGAVIADLEARGVAHEVRGEAIFVPDSERDSLRLALAAEGLPAQGGAGYELLDSLDGFGTTAQMFDAAWSRAVEGELARTILANGQITAARVHIARGQDRPFSPPSDPSASIFVTTAGGLSTEQARGFRHLVAAAVTGLRPDRVEIIDSVNGLVPLNGPGSLSAGVSDRAEAIRRNVERLLEARVGPGRAVVEVSLDLVTASESLSERTLDPQSRVAIETESESASGSETQSGGEITVASNLPDGDAGPEGGPQSNSQENRERVTYEVSETRREIVRQPGDIRRLTVAVIIDGERIVAQDGTESWQPRSPEELDALRELVLAAAGIDEARGDVLTLKSLQLAPVPELGTEAPSAFPIDLTRLAGLGLLALALLALGYFVLRPALRGAASRAEAQALALPPAKQGPIGPVLTGEIEDGGELPSFARMIAAETVDEGQQEDPVARLRRLIGERQDESIEILRSWMDTEGGKT
jgi:flagellar M-ring protein FliF